MTVSTALWRLAWALPLVLVIGALIVLALRHIGVSGRAASQVGPRLRLIESMPLSDDTRVYLVEIDRQSFWVVESTKNAVVQPASSVPEATRPPGRFNPAWMQSLYKARAR